MVFSTAAFLGHFAKLRHCPSSCELPFWRQQVMDYCKSRSMHLFIFFNFSRSWSWWGLWMVGGNQRENRENLCTEGHQPVSNLGPPCCNSANHHTTVLRLDGNQGHYMLIWWHHSLNQSMVNHPFNSKWAILSSMRLETSD